MSAHIHLTDKVAIVTGGSRGIGEAIARVFAQAGAKVVIASRKEEGINAAAARIVAAGVAESSVVPVVCHAGKPEMVQALLDTTLDKMGGLDIVVNNAGTNPYFGPMVGAEHRAWDKTFEVNARGYFDLSIAAAKHWVAADKPGSIVNVSSVAAIKAAPMQGIYGMSKAAVVSMTKTMAMELGGSKVRVNAIAPGLVDTRLAAGLVHNEDIVKPILERTPLGRYGQPEEIAGAALFLASDAAWRLRGVCEPARCG